MYVVQKIISLHMEKNYRQETVFAAVNVLDRYLAQVGHWNFPKSLVSDLAVVSLLIGAKLEESHQPNIDRLLKLLTAEEQEEISKQDIIDLEF